MPRLLPIWQPSFEVELETEPGPWTQPLTLTDLELRVLRHIRSNPGKSRTEIAIALGISKSMMSKATSKFDEIGLISQERTTLEEGERGQPPVRLRLRDSAFHSIGIYLSTFKTATALTDLSGKVHFFRERKSSPKDIVDLLLDDIRAISTQLPSKPLGVGLALPALSDAQGDLFEITPTQKNLPFRRLADAIRAEFSLPVYWDNATYCAATYESERPGNNGRCLFFVNLDFGIGGGLVSNGELFRGAFNQAANFGALVPETRPRPSLTDLAIHLGVPLEAMTEEFLMERWQMADPNLATWSAKRGKGLSGPLSTVVQLINPDTIVLGGLLPPPMLQHMLEQVSLDELDLAHRRPLTKPVLRVSELTGARGYAEAAALLPIYSRLLGQKANTAESM